MTAKGTLHFVYPIQPPYQAAGATELLLYIMYVSALTMTHPLYIKLYNPFSFISTLFKDFVFFCNIRSNLYFYFCIDCTQHKNPIRKRRKNLQKHTFFLIKTTEHSQINLPRKSYLRSSHYHKKHPFATDHAAE